MQSTSSPERLLAELGFKLYELSRYDESIASLNKSLQGDATDVPKGAVYLTLGKAYRALNKPEKAIQAFADALLADSSTFEHIDREIRQLQEETIGTASETSISQRLKLWVARRFSPSTRESFYRIVDGLIDAQNYSQAESQLRVLASFFPDDALAQEKLGLVLQRQNRLVESLNAYRQAVSRNPNSENALCGLGDIYLLQGEYEQARVFYSTVLEMASEDLRALLGRGEALRSLGMYTESEKDLRQARQLQPDNVKVYSALAKTQEAAKDKDGAVQTLLQGSQYFLEKSKIDEAARLNQLAVRMAPTNPLALQKMGLILESQNQYDEALKVFKRAAKLEESPEISRHVAEIYYRENDFSRALAAVDEAMSIAVGEKNLELLTLKGKILHQMEQYEEALHVLDEVLEMDENQAEALGERGAVLEKLGYEQEALEDYRKAVRLKPEYRQAQADLGTLLYNMQRDEDALEPLSKALELSPESQLYTLKGKCLLNLDRYKESIENFDSALRLDPDDIDAHLYRGVSLRLIGEYEPSLTSIQMAIDLYAVQRQAEDLPELGRSYTELGETLRMLGRYRQAELAFEKAISLDESDSWALSRYGETLRVSGNYDLAIEKLKRAIELDPEDTWSMFSLAAAHYDKENYRTALETLDHALELNPQDSWGQGYKGLVLRTNDRFKAAIESFDLALQLEPGAIWIMINKSIALRRMPDSKVPEALSVLEQALKLDPDNPDVLFHYGICQYLSGQHSEAVHSLERAYELDKELDAANLVRGLALDRLGMIEEGQKAHALAHGTTPDVDVYISCGRDYADMGAFELAETDFKRALEMANQVEEVSPESRSDQARCYNVLAWFYADYLGTNLEEAIELSNKAIKLAGGLRREQQKRARQLSKEGDEAAQEAVEAKKSAEEYRNTEGDCRDTLGWAYFKQGKYDLAVPELERALKLNREILAIEDHLALARSALSKDV